MRCAYIILIACILALFPVSAFAATCEVTPCNAWLNCIDPDEKETVHLCEEQLAIARGDKTQSEIAEKFEARRLSSSCTDFAACTRQDNNMCGWKQIESAYSDCTAHPENYR